MTFLSTMSTDKMFNCPRCNGLTRVSSWMYKLDGVSYCHDCWEELKNLKEGRRRVHWSLQDDPKEPIRIHDTEARPVSINSWLNQISTSTYVQPSS